MTSTSELLRQARALLLDFDGPIAALMPAPANADAAEHARAALNGIRLPSDLQTSTDHLAILRYAADCYPDRLGDVERACTEAEIGAARKCDPSPHAHDLLEYAARARIPVALVSNNSEAAVREFFAIHSWTECVGVYACRTPNTATRLKPDPFLLIEAGHSLGVDLAQSVFIGDSVSDVEAGAAVGVPVVGIAKSDQRANDLSAAGARAVLLRGDRARLIGLLGAYPPPDGD